MNAGSHYIHGIGMTSLRTRQRLIGRLREAGVHNEAVLEVMLKLPRHLFVDEALASRAYEDTALPIGFGQTISQPLIVARMTAALLADDRPMHKVLEIGTGSGYQTAVLALLVEKVFSVERVRKLLERARERMQLLGVSNAHLRYSDGSQGWPKHGPYDGILVTAAAQEIPVALLNQLAPSGRLIAPMVTGEGQQLVLLERTDGGFQQCFLGPVSFVPLLGGVL